jgi:hypothetical protein
MELEDLKFTKELKENWLNALKSGQYKQTGMMLKRDEGHCCLGVLAEIHPNLSIDKSGRNCEFNGTTCSYTPFTQILTQKVVNELYAENDNSYEKKGTNDFSTVIPLIENLPTVD